MRRKMMNRMSTKNVNRFVLLVSLLCAGLVTTSKAQDTLSYQKALELALKNNFGIKSVRITSQIAENDASFGNAGFLPDINVTALQSKSSTDTDMEFATGGTINRKGAEATQFNASANLNWTLFDGFRMFIQYDRLKTMKEAEKQALYAQINTTLSQVSITYNQINRIKESLDLLAETIAISRERLQLEQNKLIIGTGSELEVYQAKTDLNADTSAYMRQVIQYQTVKNQLVEQLALTPGVDFEVSDYWKDPVLPELAELADVARNQNPDVKRQTLLHKDQQLALKSVKAEYYPELDFNLGYTYTDQESEASQVKFLTSNGYNYNLTARFNLFQGFNQSRRIQNAKLLERLNKESLQQVQLQLETAVYTTWQSLQEATSIYNLEESNFEFAQKTLDISREKYNQGLISAVEFREAQRNWVNARLRLLNAEYDVRINQVDLMRLAGKFVRE
ncbi:TolC family protein [bacterium]|nr:MAG: TolC family protein [bacterium]